MSLSSLIIQSAVLLALALIRPVLVSPPLMLAGEPIKEKLFAQSAITAKSHAKIIHTDTRLNEGWTKSIPIPQPFLGEGDQYVVWVEHGWLQVKRQTRAGQTDWHIVLARASDATPPLIVAQGGGFHLSYRNGRFFVREEMDILRSVRERKSGAEGTLLRSHYLDHNYQSSGAAGSRAQPPVLSGWTGDGWFVVTAGASSDRFDVLMRLNPTTEKAAGFGYRGYQGTLRRAFHGNAWILDDGEMLTATRGLDALVKAKRIKEASHAQLLGAQAPALDGKHWYNTPQALAWNDLRGKVVLLDFWATWCGSCVKKLPEVQALCRGFSFRLPGFVGNCRPAER